MVILTFEIILLMEINCTFDGFLNQCTNGVPKIGSLQIM